jgi:CRP-like cAMP-binding protein
MRELSVAEQRYQAVRAVVADAGGTGLSGGPVTATMRSMARRSSVTDHIAAVPMFFACTRRELHSVSKLTTQRDVEAGKVLITENQPGQEFMIVLAGNAVASKGGVEIATFGPGDYFGEVALLDPGLRTATVVATTPMTLAVVSPSEFSQMLEEVPALSRKIMRGLARRIRELNDADVH